MSEVRLQRVVLRLVAEAEDPIAGTVLLEGAGDPIRFCGWIELMAVVNHARQRPPSSPDLLSDEA